MEKLIFKKIIKDVSLFLFISIMCVATIVWIIQAVNYLDFVSEDGHSLKVYFAYTLFSLPKILSNILPFMLTISLFYVIINYEDYEGTILASGSEVEIAFNTAKILKENNNLKIRVISVPSIELFELNDEQYKNKILGNKPIFGIEAGVVNGWEKYIDSDNFIGMSSFGASGPYKDLYKYFKITSENLIEKILKNL